MDNPWDSLGAIPDRVSSNTVLQLTQTIALTTTVTIEPFGALLELLQDRS